jgi:hypothetical protein
MGGEAAGDEIDFPVEPRGHAVNGADEGAAAAANHAHAKFAVQFHEEKRVVIARRARAPRQSSWIASSLRSSQ